ncbi:MAG: hypothetical protein HDS84_04330 [Bacteroidales bacterium]|nr:hypothetical protein [Bacteroidales bacterium]MBD5205584.1 hypothetical protein [Bacteroidales bacterium]MBD5302476.1 hypothetical protein [Bacteroides sp.]
MEATHNLKYALLEDEYLTGRYLQATVSELRPAYMMCASGDSVKHIAHIIINKRPDFIISGIRLSDGLTPAEFKRLGCNLPTVFFTAYADCIPQLEGLNVVHSALKPISKCEVEIAMEKIEALLAARSRR